MTVQTNILKLGRLDTVVSFNGTGSATFTLATCAKADESVASPVVNIHKIKWSSGAATGTSSVITITRGGIPLYQLNNSFEFDLSGSGDPTQNTADIVVNLGTSPATLVLSLAKVGGFTPPFTNVGV